MRSKHGQNAWDKTQSKWWSSRLPIFSAADALWKKKLSKKSHLIIYFPTSLEVSEWTIEHSGVGKQSKQCGASKCSVSKWANRRASGPVLYACTLLSFDSLCAGCQSDATSLQRPILPVKLDGVSVEDEEEQEADEEKAEEEREDDFEGEIRFGGDGRGRENGPVEPDKIVFWSFW